MKLELSDALKLKYGKIVPRNLIFDVPDSWYIIIDSLLESIVNYIRTVNPQVKLQISEVKAKFGRLRISYGFKDIQDMRIDGMIRAISDLSEKIK
jgi:hypothetical protein